VKSLPTACRTRPSPGWVSATLSMAPRCCPLATHLRRPAYSSPPMAATHGRPRAFPRRPPSRAPSPLRRLRNRRLRFLGLQSDAGRGSSLDTVETHSGPIRYSPESTPAIGVIPKMPEPRARGLDIRGQRRATRQQRIRPRGPPGSVAGAARKFGGLMVHQYSGLPVRWCSHPAPGPVQEPYAGAGPHFHTREFAGNGDKRDLAPPT
jgi:hypothetical protein